MKGSKIAPPGCRSVTTDGPEGLQIVIPAGRNIPILLFLSAWLVGWAVGEITVARQLLAGTRGPADLFLIAWLTMWTLGGGWAIYTWLWSAVGKEIIHLRSDALTVKRDVLGFGRTHEYDLAHVSNLRVASAVPVDPFNWGSSRRVWGMGQGIVAFDYGAKTFRFGGSVDEAEGAQLVNTLRQRHPFKDGAAQPLNAATDVRERAAGEGESNAIRR